MDLRNRRPVYFAILATIGFSIAGVAAWRSVKGSAESPPPVTAVVARRDLKATVTATGTIKAQVGAEVKVGTRIYGRVERLAVQVGDRVAAGQVIAVLQHDDLQAAVDKARADLAVAESRAAQTALDVQILRERVRNEIAREEANYGLAVANADRLQRLFEEGVLAQRDLDAARRDVRVAEATLALARADARQIESKERELAAAQQAVRAAEAALKIAQTNLSYATITAPISGVVASVSTQQGETVTAGGASGGTPTFVTIVDLRRLEAHAFVDETDIGKIRVGQRVTFTVATFPDRELIGKVTAIFPTALVQVNVVTYDVVIAIDNRDDVLRSDMTATVTIVVAERKQVLTVPNQALRRVDGQRVVYIQQGEQFVPRTVTTGWRDKTYTEILSGVQEGERVLLGEPTAQLFREWTSRLVSCDPSGR
jgi:multidrug efflux pump subunit AcrA (membrane-fusion protein)